MHLKDNTTHLETLNQKAGTKVYLYKRHDYGCANIDTGSYGESYVSVTLDPEGWEMPFFTVPERMLVQEEISCVSDI